MNLTQYMITHKSVNFIPKDRTPIFVGNGNNKFNYITDNTGDNISNKNSEYCELTAFYWMWKNDTNSQYISTEHYRRFFCSRRHIGPIYQDELLSILSNSDAIETSLYRFPTTTYEYYKENHMISDLNETIKIIKEIYPEYVDSLMDELNSSYSSMCNMLAMHKDMFDSYCEWLFNILFRLEERINILDRSDYQKRVFGFLSERLQNVWVNKNTSKITRLHIYYYDNNQLKSQIKTLYHYKDTICK